MNRTPFCESGSTPLSQKVMRSSRAQRIALIVALTIPSGFSAVGMTKSTPSGTSTSKYTIGGSLEYESNPDEHIWEAPLYLEYSPSSRLTLAAQLSLLSISSQTSEGGTESGIGDLETSADYIFIPERRFRPAIALTGTLRWPTATNSGVGDSGIDGSFGIIAFISGSSKMRFIDSLRCVSDSNSTAA